MATPRMEVARLDRDAAGIGPNLVGGDEAVIAIKRGVLDSLGPHRAGQLLETRRELFGVGMAVVAAEDLEQRGQHRIVAWLAPLTRPIDCHLDHRATRGRPLRSPAALPPALPPPRPTR